MMRVGEVTILNIVDLTQYVEYVLALSYQQCGNIQQAEDLAQASLLEAITALKKNGEVNCPKAWLKTIVSRTWIHQLREKYKQPMTVYDVPDISAGAPAIDAQVIEDEEYRSIRRELAHLAKIYRDVVVLYYVEGKSVSDIAEELGIPKGTVLSRLDKGRKLIKEGVENMEGYSECSYRPEEMSFGISGRLGKDGEPFNVMRDLLAKNIVIYAREKPVSVKEIADEMGVALPYIEAKVDELVKAQLMKYENGKVKTDFIISTQEDHYRALKIVQKSICGFEPLHYQAQERLNEISPLNREEIDDEYLEYFLISISLDTARRHVKEELVGKTEFADFPDRPNNGKWFANGVRRRSDYPADKMHEIWANAESGPLSSSNVTDRIMKIVDWDRGLGRTHSVYQGSDPAVSQEELAKLLYRIYTKSDLQDYELVKVIPMLVKLNVLRRQGEDVSVRVPIFSVQGKDRLDQVSSEIAHSILPQYTVILRKLAEFVKASYPKWYDKTPDIVVGFFASLINVPIIRWLIDKRLLKLDLSRPYPFMYMVIQD